MFWSSKNSRRADLLSPRNICVSIFVLAFILRLIFALQWHAHPYGDVPLWDAQGHDDWATHILQGELLQKTAFYSSPLYPYFLALTYAVFGHSFLMASLVNATLDSLTCVMLGLMTYAYFGSGAAILTGVLAALCRSMIFYTAPLMKESLGLFLLTIFTWMLMRAMQSGKTRDVAVSGFCLGLCALVRGNVLIFVPLVCGLLFMRRNAVPSALKHAAVFLLTTLLAILPATLHNFIASRDIVLINYDDGFNLYLGHSPWASGTSYDFPPFINTDPRPEEIVETLVARQATGQQEMSPSAVSGYWRQQAFASIINNPLRSLSLLKAKFLAFWNTHPQFDNYDLSFIQKNFATILSGPLISLWLIAPLAAFAAFGLESSRRKEVATLLTLAAAYMLSVLLFYVTERYRLPMLVFLLPLAGAALPAALSFIHKQINGRLIMASTAALMMLALTLWPRPSVDLSAYDWGTLISIETEQGHYEEALRMATKAMAVAPEKIGADGMIKASYAEEKLGHADAAAQWLDKAQGTYPENGVVLYNRGRLYAAQGELTKALASFQQAIKLTPSYALSYLGEATVEEHLGQHEQAITTLRQGLAINPDDSRLQALMAHITAPSHVTP